MADFGGSDLETFRSDVRAWLAAEYPAELRDPATEVHPEAMWGGRAFEGSSDPQIDQRGFAQERPEREPQSGRAFASALGLAESADAGVAAQVYQRRNSPNGVDVRI